MRHKRYVAAAATAGLLAIGPMSGFASAATAPGVGTASVSSTVLSVELGANGDLLSVRLLGDDGTANTDTSKSVAVASETLRPLTISSKAVPALNFDDGSVTTSSTGAEDKTDHSKAVGQAPVASADLIAVLSSLVDTASGAKSSLEAGLTNVSVAGGLLSMPSAVAKVGSAAITTDATGTRTLEIPSIEVLNLAALLNALGTSLTALPLDTLVGLLGPLGLTVPNVTNPAAAVETLQGLIDTLQTTTSTVADLCNTVDDTIDGLLTDPAGTIGAVPGGLAIAALPIDCTDTTQTVSDLIDQVQANLGALLTMILDLLANTPLLSVTNVKIGVTAKAADTVGNSVADVTASIGDVKVGTLAVPAVSGLDLGAAVETINAATEAVQAAVGGVLSQISPQLANLVDVDVLKITKDVTSADGYTNAMAGITALTATITPPTGALTLAALGDTPVSTVLGDLGSSVPAVATLMTQLEAALGGLQALSGPSTITAASLSANSSFKALGADTPSGDLPRTGQNAALPAMFAMALAGAAIAIRRVLKVVKA